MVETPRVHVVTVSTRPNRIGPAIAGWFVDAAKRHGKSLIRSVDLAEVALPLLDEPEHPRAQRYVNAHTKAWSATVAEADAFVFVTPEYNFCAPATLVNALDYLYTEWNYKPCAFVGYGGMSGAMRAIQSVKPLVTTLRMMPIPESVTLAGVWSQLEAGRFAATVEQEKAATSLLDELVRWAKVLAPMRSA